MKFIIIRRKVHRISYIKGKDVKRSKKITEKGYKEVSNIGFDINKVKSIIKL